MATGNIKLSSSFCENCDKQTKREKNGMVFGMGDLIMVCGTLGAWIVLKVLGDCIFNPWRCTNCGNKS